MKYANLIELFAERPFFEVGELILLFEEQPNQTRARLSRWVNTNKLIQLRRGKYLIPETYQKKKSSDGFIANYLYRPSYVSLHTALDFYGLIPESVKVIESVTTRQTASWQTQLGIFKYFSIHRNRFWGYREYFKSGVRLNTQQQFFIATPEKALLDLFYFKKGEWTVQRLKEMRFQNLNIININQLKKFTEQMKSKKIYQAVHNLLNTILPK